jgi:rhamnogalacturonan endolyase
MRRWGFSVLVWAACAGCGLAAPLPTDPSVAVYQTPAALFLDNGYVRAEINKTSGSLLSLKYQGREMLDTASRQVPGAWSNVVPTRSLVDAITINPLQNQGERAEVSISGKDRLVIDVRYSLARGDRGLYICQILSHLAAMPAGVISRGGFNVRLNPDLFDSLQLGHGKGHPIPTAKDWNNSPPFFSSLARKLTSGKLMGQIVYGWDDSALQIDAPIYGYTGARREVGVWIINPSCEYLGRGGNMIEPTGWLDPADGVPTLMNWWADDPAGTSLSVSAGQSWSHVFGPFLLYCNNGSAADASARYAEESHDWPHAWASKDESLPADQRATVSGRIALSIMPEATTAYATLAPGSVQPVSTFQNRYGEPAAPDAPSIEPVAISTTSKNLIVGLSPDQDWQSDLLGQQFWVHGSEDGKFSIPNVLPGNYVLHAYCDGQFSEASLGGVRVDSGKPLDLHTLTWAPPYFGSFVWQLGVPDRSAAEFRHGGDASHWGLWTLYPREFPNDVNYLIGKSDPGKDWNCIQYPGTTWAIHFPLGFVPVTGEGFLRIALAGGSDNAHLKVILNGHDFTKRIEDPLPVLSRPAGSSVKDDIMRDQLRGYSREKMITFYPWVLRLGDNVLQLRVTGPRMTDGLIYDCLRLEIDATSKQMPGQGSPAMIGPLPLGPGGMGPDFGQFYKGDPSGDYRALGRIKQ